MVEELLYYVARWVRLYLSHHKQPWLLCHLNPMYMATAPERHVSVCLKTWSCHFVFTHYIVSSAMLNVIWLCNVTKYVLACLLWLLAQLVLHWKIQYIFSNVNLSMPMNLLILQCIYLAYFSPSLQSLPCLCARPSLVSKNSGNELSRWGVHLLSVWSTWFLQERADSLGSITYPRARRWPMGPFFCRAKPLLWSCRAEKTNTNLGLISSTKRPHIILGSLETKQATRSHSPILGRKLLMS